MKGLSKSAKEDRVIPKWFLCDFSNFVKVDRFPDVIGHPMGVCLHLLHFPHLLLPWQL